MNSLTIRLLGPFRIWHDNTLIPPDAWPTQKTKSLLKVLITERGHVVPKERLMELIWGDLAPTSAANSLRVGISHLRRLLEPELEQAADSTFILTEAQGYRFQATSGCWIDVDAFRDAVARGQHWLRRRRWGPAIAAFRTVEDLYHGDYLEEDPYEDWALRVRERTRAAHLEALGQLAQGYAHLEQYDRAVATCEKVLVRDPVRESIYRQLMAYHYRRGQRAQALRAYERCRTVLLEQLEVSPMPQTQALHSRILSGEPLHEPVDVQPAAAPVRLDPGAWPGRLPFVGQEDQMERLRDHLSGAISGEGGLVLLSGEPGVGKTRLVEEFLPAAKARGAQVFHGQCHELEQDLPYQPIREGLRPYLLRHLDPEGARRILGPWAPHVAVLVPEVRELVPDLPELEPLPPEQERQRLLTGLVQFCRSLASRYPLVFFLDDLHWSDSSTLQYLHLLTRHIANERVLILAAFRADEVEPDHPLTTLEQHLTMERFGTQLTLQRLPAEAVTRLVAQKGDPAWDSRPFAQRLHQETEGNPLFLAELLQRLLEEGLLLENEAGCWQPSSTTDLAQVALDMPPMIRTIIASRYQATEAAGQQLLDLMAVIDRTFDYRLLRQVSVLETEQILNVLDELLRRQLIRERAEAGQAEYEFSHDKIREVIYDRLSQARRMHLHRQVAGALAAVYAGRTEAVAGRMAHHYTEAGELEQAARYRRQAGEEALRLSAYQEGIIHLTEGLALLEVLPDTRRRAEQELNLQMALGTALMATRGYGAPELEATHDRARELCRQIEDLPRLSLVLTRLWVYYYIRGKIRIAYDLARQFLHQAQEAEEPIPLLEMHYLEMGISLLWLGDAAAAEPYMEQALALHDPQQRDLARSIYACDSYVLCLVHRAFLLWTLGYPDRALQTIQEAVATARQLEHPFSLALALIHLAHILHLRRETQPACDYAGEATALSDKYGFAQFQAVGLIVGGGTVAHPTAADIAQIERGLAFTLDMGREVAPPSFLALLAEAQARAGQPDKALRALSQALAAADITEERWYEAELHRLRGELRLAQGETGAAERSFQTAVDIARRQQARSFELRATVSLARFLRQQDREEEARELLAEIYGWFSEGFDTPDLKEAQALLKKLS